MDSVFVFVRMSNLMLGFIFGRIGQLGPTELILVASQYYESYTDVVLLLSIRGVCQQVVIASSF